MKQVLTTLGFVGILVLFTSCVAHHSCSSQEMMAMKEKGFGIDEINRLCISYKISEEALKAMSNTLETELAKRQGGSQATPGPASNLNQAPPYRVVQGQAAICATPVVSCRLMQPGYIGAPCICYTPNGQFQGVTR